MKLEASKRLQSGTEVNADSRWDSDPSLLSPKLVAAVRKIMAVCEVKQVITEEYYGGAKILIKPSVTLEGTEDTGLDGKQLRVIAKVGLAADDMVIGIGPKKMISVVIVYNDAEEG